MSPHLTDHSTKRSRFAAGFASFAIGLAVILCATTAFAQDAGTKTFINYFEPTPITCPLTTNAWGCTATGATPANCVAGQGVVPRDTCNGIENATNPPGYYYWDGSIILAPDGTYHLFADRWLGTNGFNPGWEGSDPIHAVGTTSAFGPYTYNDYVYSDNGFGSDPHHGHNSEAVTLLDGTYAFVVSEVVPFTIFTSKSLSGPWTACANPGAGLSVPSGFGGNTSYGSNVSLVVRPDGNFEIIQRHGLVALSTSGICGPYKAQQPTNTYPANEAIPSATAASIFPNRQKHLDPQGPSSVEATYIFAEDPVIWFSGGKFHVLYDYPDDRVGYHLTSVDGITNWTDEGLAYDPRYAQQIFSYTDGTVDHWFKMERPGVVVENGHITHVTFAVSDVDKNDQISAGTDHGSKVIVIPFNGALMDCESGNGGCADAGDVGVPADSSNDTGADVHADTSTEAAVDSATDTGIVDTSQADTATNAGDSAADTASPLDTAVAADTATAVDAARATDAAAAFDSATGTDGAMTTDSGAPSANANGGCGCRVGAEAPGTRAPGAVFALLGAWVLVLVRRRRAPTSG